MFSIFCYTNRKRGEQCVQTVSMVLQLHYTREPPVEHSLRGLVSLLVTDWLREGLHNLPLARQWIGLHDRIRQTKATPSSISLHNPVNKSKFPRQPHNSWGITFLWFSSLQF